MAGSDCGSYWVVWTSGVDEPSQVEQVATFEQAYARWQALEEAAAFSAEVFGPDGLVLLNRDLWYAPRWAMTEFSPDRSPAPSKPQRPAGHCLGGQPLSLRPNDRCLWHQ